jgi:hypothetical protein
MEQSKTEHKNQDHVKKEDLEKKPKSPEVKDESDVVIEQPPGACIVGEGGGYPQYRHVREGENRTVEHPIGDQPEGVVEDPVTYPPDELPPSLQDPPPEGKGKKSHSTPTKEAPDSSAKEVPATAHFPASPAKEVPVTAHFPSPPTKP